MGVFNENAIIGTSGAGASAYSIDNSCRFNDDDSPYMARTPSGAGNRKTWTLSFWIKRSSVVSAARPPLNYDWFIFSSTNYFRIGFKGDSSIIDNFIIRSNTESVNLTTSQKFRDVGGWYHIVIAFDTTEITASDRVKLYVNGTQVTAFSTAVYPSSNSDNDWNNAAVHEIGRANSYTGRYYDGYLAEVHNIDGTALDHTSFGERGDYGEWKPKKYSGAHGTNGFYLDFKTGTLGNDAAGSNNFTLANLAAYDQVTDSPTNNFSVLNSDWEYYNSDVNRRGALSECNLKTTISQHGGFSVPNTIPVSSGKWYWEVQVQNITNSAGRFGVCTTSCVTRPTHNGSEGAKVNTVLLDYAGILKIGSTATNHSLHSGSFTAGTKYVISVRLNLDDNQIEIRQNDVSAGGPESIPAGEYEVFSDFMNASGSCIEWYNFGQDGTFIGEQTAGGNADDNGYGNFLYDVPAGFLALCTKNISDPAVVPSEHFNTVLYTGTGSARSITFDLATGTDFKPDLHWLKIRAGEAKSHMLTDAVRGVGKYLQSDGGSAELTDAQTVTSFDTDGWSFGATGSSNQYNYNGRTYVAWNWKAGGTPTATNSAGAGATPTAGSVKINGSNLGSALAGTLPATKISASTTAGFSIVSYTGNSLVGATVGHGLSQTPELIVIKQRTSTENWLVYSSATGGTQFLNLNLISGAGTTVAYWNNTDPNSSVWTMKNNGANNNSSHTYIAYCWHSVEGYSKIGSYPGNGDTDGPFIYTGFQPAYLMIKNLTAFGQSWCIFDNKRDTYNLSTHRLHAEDTTVEGSDNHIDLLSNGFKLRTSNQSTNGSEDFLYMAFAETPFKHANAR